MVNGQRGLLFVEARRPGQGSAIVYGRLAKIAAHKLMEARIYGGAAVCIRNGFFAQRR